MGLTVSFEVLNQLGTPLMYSETLANRPAFGIAGRIFFRTDSPFGIYRDTGAAWDLIAIGGGTLDTNIYNTNGTLTANRVVSDGGFGLSFTPTTHIGTAAIGGGGSGKLIVGSSTADNGIQIFGANSPSLRIDNAQSGGTQRFVFGLATATNNFIQGATAGEFCISTQSAGNMLFGMWQTSNASEVMRITTANNLLIGNTVDLGQKLQVGGSITATNMSITATNGLSFTAINNSTSFETLQIKNIGSGNIATFKNNTTTIATITNNGFDLNGPAVISGGGLLLNLIGGSDTFLRVGGNRGNANNLHVSNIEFYNSFSSRVIGEMRGITGIGGTQSDSGQLAFYTNDNGTYAERFRIKQNGVLNLTSIPTSAVGLSSGDIYSNAGILTIVP